MARWWTVAAVLLVGCPAADPAKPSAPSAATPVRGAPTRLAYSSTSPRGGTRIFTWTDGGVEMTWRARIGPGSLHRRFQPSVEEWNALWAALDQADAWNSAPRHLEDAPKRALQLEVGGRVVESAATSLIERALLEMLARADGGVVLGPEEPVSAGEGY